jgi:hypothetical protein
MMMERPVTAGSKENTPCMFCFLRYSLDRQPAPGTEPQLAALKNNRFLVSQMITTYGEGLEPNLHLPAPSSRTGRSRQATYEGKRQRKTVNDRKLLNQAPKAVFVSHVLVCTSQAPKKLKHYFSLRGMLPP